MATVSSKLWRIVLISDWALAVVHISYWNVSKLLSAASGVGCWRSCYCAFFCVVHLEQFPSLNQGKKIIFIVPSHTIYPVQKVHSEMILLTYLSSTEKLYRLVIVGDFNIYVEDDWPLGLEFYKQVSGPVHTRAWTLDISFQVLMLFSLSLGHFYFWPPL